MKSTVCLITCSVCIELNRPRFTWYEWHSLKEGENGFDGITAFHTYVGIIPYRKTWAAHHTHHIWIVAWAFQWMQPRHCVRHRIHIYFNMHGKEFQTYILLCKCSMNKLTNRCTTLYNYTKHGGEKLKPSRDTMWVSVLCSTLVLLSIRTAFPDLIWDTCM